VNLEEYIAPIFMSEELGRRWPSGNYYEKEDLLFWRVDRKIHGGGKTIWVNMNEDKGKVKTLNMEK
jgi:hypothetical protein